MPAIFRGLSSTTDAAQGELATILTVGPESPSDEHVQDFAPNAISVSNALIRHTNCDVIWLLDDSRARVPLSLDTSERLHRVRRRSPRGIAAFLRSEQVFVTHGVYGSYPPPANQVVCQLWHGMPMKRLDLVGSHERRSAFTWAVAAAPYWRPMLAEAFNMAVDQVISTGMPRAELLLRPPSEDIRSALSNLLNERSYERLLVWLPTYRRSVIGNIRLDGVEAGNTLLRRVSIFTY